MEEKESFLFTRSKTGAGLLGIFCFAVKYNVCKQLHKNLSYLHLFRVVFLALCMILPESEQSMEVVYSHIRRFLNLWLKAVFGTNRIWGLISGTEMSSAGMILHPWNTYGKWWLLGGWTWDLRVWGISESRIQLKKLETTCRRFPVWRTFFSVYFIPFPTVYLSFKFKVVRGCDSFN